MIQAFELRAFWLLILKKKNYLKKTREGWEYYTWPFNTTSALMNWMEKHEFGPNTYTRDQRAKDEEAKRSGTCVHTFKSFVITYWVNEEYNNVNTTLVDHGKRQYEIF